MLPRRYETTLYTRPETSTNTSDELHSSEIFYTDDADMNDTEPEQSKQTEKKLNIPIKKTQSPRKSRESRNHHTKKRCSKEKRQMVKSQETCITFR